MSARKDCVPRLRHLQLDWKCWQLYREVSSPFEVVSVEVVIRGGNENLHATQDKRCFVSRGHDTVLRRRAVALMQTAVRFIPFRSL